MSRELLFSAAVRRKDINVKPKGSVSNWLR